MANVGMLIKIDRKGRRLRQVEVPLFLNKLSRSQRVTYRILRIQGEQTCTVQGIYVGVFAGWVNEELRNWQAG